MIQIIKRNEGFKSEKTALERGTPQISYNDWGHLCVRLIHDDDRDTLVVFDRQTSERIIQFIRRDELPF